MLGFSIINARITHDETFPNIAREVPEDIIFREAMHVSNDMDDFGFCLKISQIHRIFQFFMQSIYKKAITTKKYVVVAPKVLKNNYYCTATYHYFSIITQTFSKISEFIYKLKIAVKQQKIKEFKYKFPAYMVLPYL